MRSLVPQAYADPATLGFSGVFDVEDFARGEPDDEPASDTAHSSVFALNGRGRGAVGFTRGLQLRLLQASADTVRREITLIDPQIAKDTIRLRYSVYEDGTLTATGYVSGDSLRMRLSPRDLGRLPLRRPIR